MPSREVKIKSATTTIAATRQVYWQVSGLHKLDALTRILEVEEDFDAAIIFVRTKTATVELADKLAAPDLFATIASRLGLDPQETVQAPNGRPVTLTDGGSVITKLIG